MSFGTCNKCSRHTNVDEYFFLAADRNESVPHPTAIGTRYTGMRCSAWICGTCILLARVKVVSLSIVAIIVPGLLACFFALLENQAVANGFGIAAIVAFLISTGYMVQIPSRRRMGSWVAIVCRRKELRKRGYKWFLYDSQYD